MNRSELSLILFSILGLIVAVILYPFLPSKIVSHWDASGNPDGYMPKTFGLFFIPVINFLLVLLLIFIPRIDPKRKNYAYFKKPYYVFIAAFELFFYLLFAEIVLWAFHHYVPINIVMGVGIGFLFIVLSYLLNNTKQNWFVGIRTPWTLESETVWIKTHKLSAKLFALSGIVIMISAFFSSNVLFWTILVSLVISITIIFTYSYLEYEKEQKN